MVTDVIQRLRRLPPIVPDGTVAVVLMITAGLAEYQDAGKLSLVQAAAIVLITLPLAARRMFPTAASAAIGAALILHLLLGFTNSFVENFAILLALYTLYASARSGWRIAVMSLILVIGLSAGVALGWRSQHHVYLSDIGYNAIIFALPVILGYGVRTRRAYVAQLQEQSKLLAREAAADERTAIARELHDVIAHSVSVMVLQATAGRRLARRDPANAAAAFEVIDGTPRPLAPGVELSAYRIVQESLTNVLRHSGADDAVVAIRYGLEDLTVEVTDNGRNGTAPSRDGTGLTGMRERVALLHGEFRAGSTSDGFSVTAQPLVRAGLRTLLDEEADIEVAGDATNGEEAVAAVTALAPNVVLMDIRMPVLDGLEATRRITAHRCAARIVILTTFDLDEYVFQALRAGASGFLLKDATGDEIVRAVRVAASGDALLAPYVTRRLIERFSGHTPSADAPHLRLLTERERDVLLLVARGLSNGEIAARLFLGETTVKTHVAHLLDKLELRDRVQAVVLAYESGLVEPGLR